MKEQLLSELKKQFIGTVPPGDVIKNVLSEKESQTLSVIYDGGKLNYDQMRVGLEEVIRLIYENSFKKVKNLARLLNLRKPEILDLARIAFDIASTHNQYENMYEIMIHYHLDPKRFALGSAHYIKMLVEKGLIDQAYNFKKEYLRNADSDTFVSLGENIFKESMSFSSEEEQRDYSKAIELKKLFNLNDKTTQQFALSQYEYNINHGNYIEAATLGKMFHLPPGKIHSAAFQIFQQEFNKFEAELESGDYSRRTKSSEDDHYTIAVKVLKDFGVLDKEKGKDKESENCRREIRNKGIAVAKNLVFFYKYGDINNKTATLLGCKIIADFRLFEEENETRRTEYMAIAKQAVGFLKDSIRSMQDAHEYYDVVALIYKQAPTLQGQLREVGEIIFDMALDYSLVKLLQKTVEDFELNIKDRFPSLKKKCLDLLENKNWDDFKTLTDSFHLVEKLNTDEDFLSKLYTVYQELISSQNYDDAIKITRVFRFSLQKRMAPIRIILHSLLIKENDEEAIKILKTFNIRVPEFKKVFIDAYIRRVTKNSHFGSIFRKKFGLSIGQIGLGTWFFSEVLISPFLRRIFTGIK